jgi:hypothetical protein
MAIKRIPNMKNIIKGGLLPLVLLTFVFAVFTGCSSEKKEVPKATAEEQVEAKVSTESVARGSAMPSDHPAFDETTDAINKASHANIRTKKELDISDEVKATWKEVQIEITDNAAKLTKVVTLQVGSVVQLTDEGHHLKIEILVPDYAIAENKIQSRSNEPNNPAVLVDLLEKDKSVARGWVFREFPEFNSFNNPRFHLVLVAPGAAKKAEGK